VLSEVRRKHPSIFVEMVAETRLADLARREADVAIRNGKSSSPVVAERPVGRLRFGLYASQSYVERRLRGGRLLVEDFPRHDFVGLDGAHAKLATNQWLMSRGATRFVFRSNSDFARQEAAEQGQGICMLADAAVRSVPGLVRLDVDAELPAPTLYLAFHPARGKVPRVRLVIEALAAALRDAL
jgi:DNA-binding transcriptional LysR family regulator